MFTNTLSSGWVYTINVKYVQHYDVSNITVTIIKQIHYTIVLPMFIVMNRVNPN